jgi:hypothetical protein
MNERSFIHHPPFFSAIRLSHPVEAPRNSYEPPVIHPLRKRVAIEFTRDASISIANFHHIAE